MTSNDSMYVAVRSRDARTARESNSTAESPGRTGVGNGRQDPGPSREPRSRWGRLSGSDARASVVLYAAVGAAMCASWVLLYAHLRRRPALLNQDVKPQYVCLGVVRAQLGVVVYALAGVVGALVHPVIALVAFLVLPVFYFLTSEGFLPAGRDTCSPSL